MKEMAIRVQVLKWSAVHWYENSVKVMDVFAMNMSRNSIGPGGESAWCMAVEPAKTSPAGSETLQLCHGLHITVCTCLCIGVQEDSLFRVLQRSSPPELLPQKPVFQFEQFSLPTNGRSSHREPMDTYADKTAIDWLGQYVWRNLWRYAVDERFLWILKRI